ncbi:putative succinyldiaminopimelate transaminase DapC [Egibacter rhizosphaerae]|uniref:Putative succinyldiaminopimelate transaminase DapC n=1 Tax=Egibacter rhizosphaerae TaxID=1670831 RepID=A0A411YKB9_9ACTN|nr:pyridoxal phosphate-dependent aminotransferase [Egibacter rhizosphaerae]QBI21636.1 putative succinyldiaminopimelate transaminase DapC [Egibacter rhizosphaerae]
MRTPYLTSRLQGFGTTVFAQMSALAERHRAVNLGQGFPDFDGPGEVLEAAITAIREGHNQYAPGPGVAPLREAVAAHQQRFWGLDYDPESEIIATAGATEAICAGLQALCEVGDEVVVFEPFYDSYRAGIAMAGAVPSPVPLDRRDLAIDPAALRAAVSPKTRLVLLNSPHNPTGKVFTREELAEIAAVCVEHDLIAVTDEVYEHLTFDVAHHPLATFPGMRERTVTVSSAGKTFSVTGWKIGWLCAPPDLANAVRTAKQFMTFVNGTPFQYAVAVGLALDDEYFANYRADYRSRRDRLVEGLATAGFDVRPPDGTYFVTADLGDTDDVAWCLDLPERAGVVAVPQSVFYAEPARGRGLVRFAFCKTDAVLDAGISRLERLRS